MLGAPFRLRCEYLSNPLGIDVTRPRLSWWVNDDRAAEIQTAFHLLAASSAELLAADQGDLWDTGKTESQQTLNAEYRGKPLISGQQVWWKVRTFDSDGLPSHWSEPGRFEVGLLGADDWRARWISTPLRGSPATPVQAPVLRRSFELPDGITAARLHITALGVYRAQINGAEVTDDRLTPGWTDYRQRVRYQTYDVTGLLRPGANAIGVLLGDGWYCGNPGVGLRQQYGERPQLLAQINVTLASGALLLICTDYQWRWQRSWMLHSDPVRGESVDGRQFLPAWSEPADAGDWYPVTVEDYPAAPLCATLSPGLRADREIRPIGDPRCDQRPGSVHWTYDFGQVLVGWVRVRLVAREGAQLRLRYARACDAAGELVQLDAGIDWYTTAGAADGEVFEPCFSLHGFRYVELAADLPEDAQLEVAAMAVSAALPRTGSFSSDHELLNELFADLHRNHRCRALVVPAAGADSERRLGLTGEIEGLLPTSVFNFDVAAFYGKWLDDVTDAQLESGAFPAAVPAPPGAAELQGAGQAGWSDVFASCLWAQYRYFGNRRVLERHYPTLRAFLGGLRLRWPEHVCKPCALEPVPGADSTPTDLTATAVFFQTARLAARIAGVLGNLHDLEEFEELAQAIRTAFRQRFVTRDGRMVGDSDAGYVLALQLGLLERGEQRAAFERIVNGIERGGGQGTPDPLAMPYLLQVLTRGGRVDLAYEMLLQPGPDGWLQRTLADPGLLWDQPGAGPARTAIGTIGEWLYTGLAGIDLDGDLSDSHNAFRRVRIQPRPPLGASLAVNAYGPPIRSVHVRLDTVSGRFECGWEISDTAFELRVVVPCNCSAVAVMPDDVEHVLGAGRHELSMPFVDASDGIPILREVSEAS